MSRGFAQLEGMAEQISEHHVVSLSVHEHRLEPHTAVDFELLVRPAMCSSITHRALRFSHTAQLPSAMSHHCARTPAGRRLPCG